MKQDAVVVRKHGEDVWLVFQREGKLADDGEGLCVMVARKREADGFFPWRIAVEGALADADGLEFGCDGHEPVHLLVVADDDAVFASP